MGYSIYLFRKEVKEQNETFDFLEIEALIEKFSEDQFNKLKIRLLKYKYQIEKETNEEIVFNFKGGEHNIQVMLRYSGLYFSSGFSEDGIFEINMTASEFTDSDEFVKLDPQEGEWEVN